MASPMKRLLLLILALLPTPLAALDKSAVELELDAYYTALSLNIPLARHGGQAQGEQDEIKTYRNMLARAWIPSFLVLEGSINPLPVTGLILRNNAPGFYQKSQVTPSLNLVQAVTAGFEEPYAASLFLGKVVDFSTEKKVVGHKRRGYVGYLASAGNYHILENRAIADNWLELEWKVKGDQSTERRKMSWSFRGGGKLHSNADVADTYYLGIKRDRVDYEKGPLSFLLSSAVDYRMDLGTRNLRALRHRFLVEKNIPLPKRKITLSLGIGYLWLGGGSYTGGLAQHRDRAESQILIRPNLKF